MVGPRIAIALIVALVALAGPELAHANETVTACGPNLNHTFLPSSAYGGINVQATCPGGPMGLTTNGNPMHAGQGAIWQANTPAGLTIVGASIPAYSLESLGVNSGTNGQYKGYFYWSGGTSNIVPGEQSASFAPISSEKLGFFLGCGVSTCTASAKINVFEIQLYVQETSGPWISSPVGLWPAQGWVRGTWPVVLFGDSPSGVCGLAMVFAGQSLPASTAAPDTSQWHQCAAPALGEQVNTQDYPQGADSLEAGGWDAAGESVTYTKTVYVDNQVPAVTLSGPTDAPSTAGVQHVTATATAGPSGVAGMNCSLDGGTAKWYPGATVQLPVSGIGEHIVKCSAENNAKNASGVRGSSAAAAFAIKIGEPTVSALSFSRLVDRLSCRKVVVRTRHGSRTEKAKVVRCHVRSVRRHVTIWVTVRRHGKKVRVREHVVVRVVLEPRTVTSTHELVRHGRPATVHGWLGTASGTALAGQTVDVLTAPDNGQDDFQLATTATTGTNGAWAARLPAGPSRLITAQYAGGPTTQSSLAAPVSLTVPAKVELLSVRPRSVPWGGTVKLAGALRGGYLPPGGALVRLRIGLGSAFTTFGVHEHVGGDGRFTTAYTFGAGDPATLRSYWFQVASLPMGDYPYAPASSRRMTVRVGGHPPAARHG